MRSPIAAVGVFALAVAIGVIVMAGDRRALDQTTGIVITRPIADLPKGSEGCQRSLVTRNAVSAVGLHPVQIGGPAGFLTRVLDASSGREMARGFSTPRYYPIEGWVVKVRPLVPAGRRVDVCLKNTGPAGLALYGDDGMTSQCALSPSSLGCVYKLPHPISSVSTLELDDRPVRGTLALQLYRHEPRTVLADLGAIFERASTFRPSLVTPLLWWLLLICATVGTLGLLAWGLRGLDVEKGTPR